MSNRDCKHGQLGRTCNICELEEELGALQAENERLRKDAETDQHPCCWVPSKALKELERGMNNSPCILTDAPAEFNDTPLYRDPAGTIAAQQQILNRLAEVLDMKAGDVDGLITRAVRVRKDAERYQWLKDKRMFRISSVDMAGKHTYSTAGCPIGSGRDIDEAIDAEIGNPLAVEEAGNDN